jgi:hypothetical protein
MTAEEAMLRLQQLLNEPGPWSPDTFDEIVLIMEQAGYAIEDEL